MFNIILLKNIIQQEISIDLSTVSVNKSLTGFYCLPKGLHYVSVIIEGRQSGFWHYFKGEEEVIAKLFNEEKHCFEDWNDEEAKGLKKLAFDEEMDDDLIVYPKDAINIWKKQVFFIKEFGKIPALKLSGSEEKQSFTELFNEVHKGDIVSVMAEFQYAFVRMAVQPMGGKDEEAVERWKEMMEIFYSATIDEIDNAHQFFIDWISFMLDQFETLPDRTFQRTGESTTYKVIVKNAASLCDRLIKSSYKGTVQIGRELKRYLEQRGAKL